MPGRHGVFFRHPDVVGLIGSDEGTKNPGQDYDENNRGPESTKRLPPGKEPESLTGRATLQGSVWGRQRWQRRDSCSRFTPIMAH